LTAPCFVGRIMAVCGAAPAILLGRRFSAAQPSSRRSADMSLTDWMKSFLSHRGKAISLYRSGIVKATKHDYEGAIADYSAAIEEPKIPADVKAMALYNRALSYSAIHEDAKGAEDLAAVLEMPGLPANIKVHAQQRRDRIRHRDKKGTDPVA
jgi:hypothetical protein